MTLSWTLERAGQDPNPGHNLLVVFSSIYYISSPGLIFLTCKIGIITSLYRITENEAEQSI
jgi:hypothetical protein